MGSGQVRTLTHYVADGETRCNMKVRRGEVTAVPYFYKGLTPASLDPVSSPVRSDLRRYHG
jgi:hypothetical protein